MVEAFLDPSDLSYLYLRVVALGAWVGPGHCSVNGQGVAFLLGGHPQFSIVAAPQVIEFLREEFSCL